METYSSNCYGFMHAGLLNSEDEFYLARDEAFEGMNGIKKLNRNLNIIQDNTAESIQDCLSGNIENKFSIVEIFDENKKSQHVAFMDNEGKFYDQDGPDGPIRLGENMENLFEEYKEKLGGTTYYQIHILNKDLSTKVKNFLDDLQ